MMDEEKTRDAYIGFRCKPELKARLEEKAKAARWSLSQYVEIALEQHIEANDKPTSKRKK